MAADMPVTRKRRIGDDCLPSCFIPDRTEGDISFLLDRIHGFYKAALKRLPVKGVPSLAPRLLKAGVCFGFLDPVSNIIINTIAYSFPSYKEDQEDVITKKKLIFSKIITDLIYEPKVFKIPLPGTLAAGGMTIARWSLEGLVGFLVYNFRYLSEVEALRYLRLAGADLLAAVRLIEKERKIPSELQFDTISLSTKVALECAAVSARHPEPDVLVSTWLSMASWPVIASVVQRARLSPSAVKHLTKLLKGPPDLAVLPLHVRKTTNKRKRGKQPALGNTRRVLYWEPGMEVTKRYTETLKLLLLGKIHGLYLEALGRLPLDGLRKGHHCSLLRGGYCYGPSKDPVSNIVLNTIWYGHAFPTHPEFQFDFSVDMLCTNPLMRVECRSLYGIVAFLRARLSSLTEPEALWYLLVSNGDVWSAIRMARRRGHRKCGTYLDCYREAALASDHPHPDALVKFATSSAEMPHMLPQVPLASGSEVLSKNQEGLVLALREKFRSDQEFFVSKINAALEKFSQQNGVDYQLHFICGVNPKVTEGSRACVGRKEYKYFHTNFWATPTGSSAAPLTAPVLFFAECSNSDTYEVEGSCFPVLSSWVDHARCFYCESSCGVNIVHPLLGTYNGRRDDFMDMAAGDSVLHETIIRSYHLEADYMGAVSEDFIYFDPNMDTEIAQANPVKNWAVAVRRWGRII